jgi:2-dehydro-3-deoxygalactonokinase
MYFATIDCGTTNSRVYIVDENAKTIGQAENKVGVRDTAIHGNNQALKKGLTETFYQALEAANVYLSEVRFIISSGMITSEIGLLEIPHLWAPAGMTELAKNIKKVHDISIFPVDIPIYFIRGIKNLYNPKTATIKNVGKLDFMRGEETQIAGLFALYDITPPFTTVVLSSHTKFIPVDGLKNILGSVTTVSGQVYEAIVKETFVGKSIREDGNFDEENYFDEEIVHAAFYWLEESGFLRSLLIPRFMDTLLATKWYERKLFMESIIASEDIKAMSQLKDFDFPSDAMFILIGPQKRSLIYEYLLKEKMKIKNILKITNKQDIDHLSITGALNLAKLAGLIE